MTFPDVSPRSRLIAADGDSFPRHGQPRGGRVAVAREVDVSRRVNPLRARRPPGEPARSRPKPTASTRHPRWRRRPCRSAPGHFQVPSSSSVGEPLAGVRVPVAPAVHRDRGDVPVGVEPARSEHARQLVAHVELEVLERGVVQQLPRRDGGPRRTEATVRHRRDMHQVQHHGLVRRSRTPVVADAHGVVELQPGEEAHRVRDLVHAEAHPRMPVAHGDLRVGQRRLDVARSAWRCGAGSSGMIEGIIMW